MEQRYDLIIIGAGPSGVFTAYELIQLGANKNKKILIIEQGKQVEKRYCPIEKTGECIKCKPYCNITCGFSGTRYRRPTKKPNKKHTIKWFL